MIVGSATFLLTPLEQFLEGRRSPTATVDTIESVIIMFAGLVLVAFSAASKK